MRHKIQIGLLLVFLAALPAVALTVEEFRALPDNRVAVRQSLGVRTAYPLSENEVAVLIGMSVTDACQTPGAYRIVSYDDSAYAYERFVRPDAVEVEKSVEMPGVKGAPFSEFRRTLVRLRLPHPLRTGATYHVIAQGVGQGLVTGGHTAASFAYQGAPQNDPRDPALDAAAIGLRAVEPVGAGVLRLEFGPGFAPTAGNQPANYQVTVQGTASVVKALGRITKVDTYLPIGWPFTAIPMHYVFLKLATPYADGNRIEVEVAPEVTAGARTAALDYADQKTFSSSLKVNQVGYLTDSPVKVAYLGQWLGSFPEAVSAAATGDSLQDMFWSSLDSGEVASAPDLSPALLFSEAPAFHLCDSQTGKIVHTGQTKLIHRSGNLDEGTFKVDHSGENVYLMDFTDFAQAGEYFISVPGVGRSASFRIAPDVYAKAFQVQAYGVFAQRCGIELAPPYSEWRRIACHNKGITPTTQLCSDGERANGSLPDHVDYSGLAEAPLAPAVKALNADPALLAYWPLDGDFRDVSGHNRDLLPLREGQTFEEVPVLMPGRNLALGPTSAGVDNGGMVTSLALNAESGFSLALWGKFPGGIKFDGTLMGCMTNNINVSRVQLVAMWGVLRGYVGSRGDPIDAGRLSDGKWHHLALVAEPGTQALVRLYLDGELAGTAKAGSGTLQDLPFHVGSLTGDEAGGKYFDDVRVYGRPLKSTEVRTLAQRWGDQALAIQTYGGHHDAGDYNPRSHIEVAQILMNAYEIAPRKFYDGQLNIPENTNGLPDVLDEAYWAIRLWLDLQTEDGGVRGGTESNGDPNFVQSVELDILGDYAFAPDAAASFTLAGVLAQASRIWKDLGKESEASDFLARARKAYIWAMAHPPAQSEGPGQYAQWFLSPKAYAAAELLHTTGEASYRSDFAAAAVWSKKPDADLEKHRLYSQSAAAWAYVKCPTGVVDAALQESVRKAIFRQADEFITYSSTMAYAFIRHPWAPISWGTGAYENWLNPIIWAYALSGDARYKYWMVRTCDNTLGANPLGLSYITDLGTRTVRASLHNSRFSPLGEVAPGMQVQGPNQRGDGYRLAETAYPKYREDFASLYTFVDCHFAIVMNEGTVVPMAQSMAIFGLLLPDR
jgi:hypothetical protein